MPEARRSLLAAATPRKNFYKANESSGQKRAPKTQYISRRGFYIGYLDRSYFPQHNGSVCIVTTASGQSGGRSTEKSAGHLVSKICIDAARILDLELI